MIPRKRLEELLLKWEIASGRIKEKVCILEKLRWEYPMLELDFSKLIAKYNWHLKEVEKYIENVKAQLKEVEDREA